MIGFFLNIGFPYDEAAYDMLGWPAGRSMCRYHVEVDMVC